MDSLQALRIDLARRSKWNIGYFAAGFVYWCFAAVVGAVLPIESARVWWMIGGLTIFPMAIVLSRLLGSDPFTKGNTLSSLIALTHVSLIYLLMPLVVVAFLRLPTALPLAMAICFGVSYPVFSWAFGDRIFLWHSIIRVLGATVIWFALPQYRYTLLPSFVAVAYLATTVILPGRREAWLRAHTVDDRKNGSCSAIG
ncbi:MAG TPA: hypothetical protein VGZ27_17640 [Vicinamibacterales bacterium]|jgi:hypothetical protein|nr:hypothetical protein [Vicinamibacterales bacterium]